MTDLHCQSCGHRISAFDAACAMCGKPIKRTPPIAPAYAQPGQSPWRGPGPQYNDDAPSFGFALIGFLIPIAGFIIWLCTRDSTPQKAGSALRGALWSIGLNIAAVLFFIFLIILLGASARP